MNIVDFFFWFKEYSLIILWLIGILIAYKYGGRNLALIVLTFGTASYIYSKGRKDEREQHDERVTKIEKKREEAYEQINNRATNRGDVIDRLHKGDY